MKSHSYLTIPNIVTFSQLLLGVILLVLIITTQDLRWMIGFSVLAILDFLDGFLARLWNQTSDFGMHLDSLADFSSFTLMPSTILWIIFYGSGNAHIFWYTLVMIFFVFCGAFRLARFGAQKTKEKEAFHSYVGLPVTFSGFLIPLLMLASDTAGTSLVIIIGMFIIGLLQISSFSLPKYRVGKD